MFFFIPIILLIIINILISSHFSPTWDFAAHLLAGQIRLGEAVKPPGYVYTVYGIFTDLVPLLFSRLFPSFWFPSSYLLFGVLIGCLGVIFFYLLVKEAYGPKIASFSTLTLLLLPRFVGHLHTNTKDVVTVSFFIISAYFLHRYLTRKSLRDGFFSLVFYIFSVNTKITAFQLYPVFILWIIFHYYFSSPKKLSYATVIKFIFMAVSFILFPLIFWFIFWPGPFSSFFSSISFLSYMVSILPTSGYRAIEQLIATTPLPVLFFIPFGLSFLWQKAKKEKHSVSFLFIFLFFYTLLKYPVFGFPVIDDVRYFLEVYFPLALAFVLGVNYLFKRYASFICLLFILYSFVLNVIYHPYQINYYNSLPFQKDPDFWAASYREVFDYINKEAKEGTIVSARLAPELANYLIRGDLKTALNSKTPEASGIVVILNRPSVFPLFKVADFYASHRPARVFTSRLGVPLSFIYFNSIDKL